MDSLGALVKHMKGLSLDPELEALAKVKPSVATLLTVVQTMSATVEGTAHMSARAIFAESARAIWTEAHDYASAKVRAETAKEIADLQNCNQHLVSSLEMAGCRQMQRAYVDEINALRVAVAQRDAEIENVTDIANQYAAAHHLLQCEYSEMAANQLAPRVINFPNGVQYYPAPPCTCCRPTAEEGSACARDISRHQASYMTRSHGEYRARATNQETTNPANYTPQRRSSLVLCNRAPQATQAPVPERSQSTSSLRTTPRTPFPATVASNDTDSHSQQAAEYDEDFKEGNGNEYDSGEDDGCDGDYEDSSDDGDLPALTRSNRSTSVSDFSVITERDLHDEDEASWDAATPDDVAAHHEDAYDA